MGKGILGVGFDRNVTKQLNIRKEILNSSSDIAKLYLTHGNNAWIRICSSVNTVDSDTAKALESATINITEAGTSAELAKNHVLGLNLESGINSNNTYTPINISQDLSFTPGNTANSMYNNYVQGDGTSTGIKAKPGITSFKVDTKGSFGQVREATVTLHFNTLLDLEVAQAVYFRPGYTMLVEWGHTTYFTKPDNTQDISTNTTPLPLPLDKWFTSNSFINLEKELLTKREDHNYNYDGFVGYVTNFNWQFNQDGTYTGTFKVISKGSVISSLSATVDPTLTMDATEFSNEDSEKDNTERFSVFHKFQSELEKHVDSDKPVQHLDIFKDSKTAKSFYKLLDQNNFSVYNMGHVELKDSGFWDNDDISPYFIPMSVFLDLLNKFVLLKDPTQQGKKGAKSVIEFFSGEQQNTLQQSIESDRSLAKYYTNDYHFSIDPMVTVLPNFALLPLNINSGAGGDRAIDFNRQNKFQAELTKDVTQFRKGGADCILNIPIAMHTITGIINGITQDTTSDSDSVLNVVQAVLDKVNDALGGIVQLTTYYVEEDNLFHIIDKNNTDTDKLDDFEQLQVLELTGTSSLVTDLNISTEFSNKLASMTSIAAQSSSGNTKENVSSLLSWNFGLVDRHALAKTQTGGVNSNSMEAIKNSQDKAHSTFFKDFTEALEEFNSYDADYNPTAFKNLKNYHKHYTQEYVFRRRLQSNKKPIPGIIPLKLSFTTLGISGLKIGQAFKVNKGILPTMYTDNFAYLVTGISHEIIDSRWHTTVTTQFYNTRQLN